MLSLMVAKNYQLHILSHMGMKPSTNLLSDFEQLTFHSEPQLTHI